VPQQSRDIPEEQRRVHSVREVERRAARQARVARYAQAQRTQRCASSFMKALVILALLAALAHSATVITIPGVGKGVDGLRETGRSVHSMRASLGTVLHALRMVYSMSTAERMCVYVDRTERPHWTRRTSQWYDVDRHAIRVARDLRRKGSVPNLARLGRELTGNWARLGRRYQVRAIFRFVIEIMDYDHELVKCYKKYNFASGGYCRETGSVEAVLGSRRGVCADYSRIVEALCSEAGVPALLLSGVSKAMDGSPGEPHAWNAFKTDDGAWVLFDATWAQKKSCRNDACTVSVREQYWCALPNEEQFHCKASVISAGRDLPFFGTPLGQRIWDLAFTAPRLFANIVFWSSFALVLSWLLRGRRRR